jgi:hypothetical protein
MSLFDDNRSTIDGGLFRFRCNVHPPQQVSTLRIDFTTHRSPFINESMVLCSPDEEGSIYMKSGLYRVEPMNTQFIKLRLLNKLRTNSENRFTSFFLP